VSFSPQQDLAAAAQAASDAEVIDALPVLDEETQTLRPTPVSATVARSGSAVIPAVQAAAVAAGGFVAGAAIVSLAQRRQRQAAAPLKRRRRGGARSGRTVVAAGGELMQIVSSRSLLLDVHLLGPAGQQR
jgi:hypothetical protein